MSVTLDDRRDVAAIHPIEFRTEYQPVMKPGPGGKMIETGQVEPADWVTWVKKGDAHGATTSEKISRVKRDEPIWQAVRPFYEAWKAGQQAEMIGTPLDAAAFVTKEMVRALAAVHIRSVEDLANAEDAALAKLNIPGIRNTRAKAKAFLENQANSAGVSAELAALREMVEQLQADKAEAERARDAMAAEAGRRRRTRDEVMQAPSEG